MLKATFGDRSICRLGLASRGNTHLSADDVLYAVDAGIQFLNWHGRPNGMSDAIAGLGGQRQQVMICAQFDSRDAKSAKAELAEMLEQLGTDFIDVLTLYYVEAKEEWDEIISPGGAMGYLQQAKQDGIIKHIGLTSHQRPMAANWAESGLIDMLMIRYNAAHRGAETDIFPVTDRLGMPVVVYTCLRWGALLQSTRDDPQGFIVPPAPAWYRFALQSQSVTVALMAPDDRQELEENLSILENPASLSEEVREQLSEHGKRVRAHAGYFP